MKKMENIWTIIYCKLSFNTDFQKQLAGYLKRMKLNKGYMLTYSFKKSKEIGVKTVKVEGKELFEAIV